MLSQDKEAYMIKEAAGYSKGKREKISIIIFPKTIKLFEQGKFHVSLISFLVTLFGVSITVEPVCRRVLERGAKKIGDFAPVKARLSFG